MEKNSVATQSENFGKCCAWTQIHQENNDSVLRSGFEPYMFHWLGKKVPKKRHNFEKMDLVKTGMGVQTDKIEMRTRWDQTEFLFLHKSVRKVSETAKVIKPSRRRPKIKKIEKIQIPSSLMQELRADKKFKKLKEAIFLIKKDIRNLERQVAENVKGYIDNEWKLVAKEK